MYSLDDDDDGVLKSTGTLLRIAKLREEREAAKISNKSQDELASKWIKKKPVPIEDYVVADNLFDSTEDDKKRFFENLKGINDSLIEKLDLDLSDDSDIEINNTADLLDAIGSSEILSKSEASPSEHDVESLDRSSLAAISLDHVIRSSKIGQLEDELSESKLDQSNDYSMSFESITDLNNQKIKFIPGLDSEFTNPIGHAEIIDDDPTDSSSVLASPESQVIDSIVRGPILAADQTDEISKLEETSDSTNDILIPINNSTPEVDFAKEKPVSISAQELARPVSKTDEFVQPFGHEPFKTATTETIKPPSDSPKLPPAIPTVEPIEAAIDRVQTPILNNLNAKLEATPQPEPPQPATPVVQASPKKPGKFTPVTKKPPSKPLKPTLSTKKAVLDKANAKLKLGKATAPLAKVNPSAVVNVVDDTNVVLATGEISAKHINLPVAVDPQSPIKANIVGTQLAIDNDLLITEKQRLLDSLKQKELNLQILTAEIDALTLESTRKNSEIDELKQQCRFAETLLEEERENSHIHTIENPDSGLQKKLDDQEFLIRGVFKLSNLSIKPKMKNCCCKTKN